MTQRANRFIRGLYLLVLIGTLALAGGCATTAKHVGEQLPPILAQDELLQPYQKVGVIEVRRERYGSPQDLTPADFDWGHQALRQEAARLGADAVIFPEIRASQQTYILFPSSEITAKGIAIKFR